MISTPKSMSREPKKKLGMYSTTETGSRNRKISDTASPPAPHALRDRSPRDAGDHMCGACCCRWLEALSYTIYLVVGVARWVRRKRISKCTVGRDLISLSFF